MQLAEPVKAKTKHGEITIDELAEIQPGMAKLMQEVGDDYTFAYFAAKGGNWKLAAHELNLVRATFRRAKALRPKFAADLDSFDAEFLLPIFKAIQLNDWAAAEDAFQKGIEGSDAFHDKYGYSYIRFIIPNESPTRLHLGPLEGFKRQRARKD